MATVFIDRHGGVLSVLSDIGWHLREVSIRIDPLSAIRRFHTGPRLHANAMRMEVNPNPSCDEGVRRYWRAIHSQR